MRLDAPLPHAYGDPVHLLLGPDLYWTMVLGRGWSESQLADWTERVVLEDLFGVDPPVV